MRRIVMDVTEDNTLARAVRRQRQIDPAAHISDQATRVKLADKISNLRDVAGSPPSGWRLQRRQAFLTGPGPSLTSPGGCSMAY